MVGANNSGSNGKPGHGDQESEVLRSNEQSEKPEKVSSNLQSGITRSDREGFVTKEKEIQDKRKKLDMKSAGVLENQRCGNLDVQLQNGLVENLRNPYTKETFSRLNKDTFEATRTDSLTGEVAKGIIHGDISVERVGDEIRAVNSRIEFKNGREVSYRNGSPEQIKHPNGEVWTKDPKDKAIWHVSAKDSHHPGKTAHFDIQNVQVDNLNGDMHWQVVSGAGAGQIRRIDENSNYHEYIRDKVSGQTTPVSQETKTEIASRQKADSHASLRPLSQLDRPPTAEVGVNNSSKGFPSGHRESSSGAADPAEHPRGNEDSFAQRKNLPSQEGSIAKGESLHAHGDNTSAPTEFKIKAYELPAAPKPTPPTRVDFVAPRPIDPENIIHSHDKNSAVKNELPLPKKQEGFDFKKNNEALLESVKESQKLQQQRLQEMNSRVSAAMELVKGPVSRGFLDSPPLRQGDLPKTRAESISEPVRPLDVPLPVHTDIAPEIRTPVFQPHARPEPVAFADPPPIMSDTSNWTSTTEAFPAPSKGPIEIPRPSLSGKGPQPVETITNNTHSDVHNVVPAPTRARGTNHEIIAITPTIGNPVKETGSAEFTKSAPQSSTDKAGINKTSNQGDKSHAQQQQQRHEPQQALHRLTPMQAKADEATTDKPLNTINLKDGQLHGGVAQNENRNYLSQEAARDAYTSPFKGNVNADNCDSLKLAGRAQLGDNHMLRAKANNVDSSDTVMWTQWHHDMEYQIGNNIQNSVSMARGASFHVKFNIDSNGHAVGSISRAQMLDARQLAKIAGFLQYDSPAPPGGGPHSLDWTFTASGDGKMTVRSAGENVNYRDGQQISRSFGYGTALHTKNIQRNIGRAGTYTAPSQLALQYAPYAKR